MKFNIGDRVFFKRYDGYNSREDRGLGKVIKAGHLGVDYYGVEFDKEVNYKTHETFYDSDLRLFNDADEGNCPKCYERMEEKSRDLYQCFYCKNIEVR